MKSEPRIASHQAQSRRRFSAPVTCLFGVVVGLISVLLLSEGTQLINNVPLDKSPKSLAARSRQILRELGYADSPADVWFGFAFDDSWKRFVENRETSAERWDSLKTGEMPVIAFQYRQSPLPLDPLNRLQVTFDDPPQSFSNMASMILDGQGHLLTFFRVPPQVEEPRTTPSSVPDWSVAFREAGLNLEEFQRAAPHWTPPYYGDAQSAWEGSIPGKNRIPVRIEAAAYRGKVVYFEIVHPNSTSYRQVELTRSNPWMSVGLVLMACLVSLAVVIVFIYRARWQKRIESESAFRLGVLVFLVAFLRNVFLNHHLRSVREFRLIAEDIAASLLVGTLASLLCVALEPFARKRWQQVLLSWRRLLSGSLRDPIVGRDTLVGCLFGVALSVTRCGNLVAPQLFGHPPVFPGAGLAGFTHLMNPVVGALSAINTALFLGLGLFFVFAFSDLILQKVWAAALVLGATLTTAFVLRSHSSWADYIFAALSSVLLILCLTRFGLLSQVVLFFAHDLTYRELSITWHLNSWFATGTVLMLVLVLGVATYGFWTWLGGEETAMRKPSLGRSKSATGEHSPDSRLERTFLLKLLSRTDASGDAQLRKEAGQIDWAHLFSIGSPDLHAFLGYKLAQVGLNEQCPACLREQAVSCRRSIAAQWLRFGFDLRQLAEAFIKHDVDFLLVKGAVLAFNAYPHYSLRSMADIDIVVHPDSLDKALELTHKAGFGCPERFRFAQPQVLKLNPKFFASDREVSLPLQKPGTRSLIELHTELETTEPWFQVSPRAMWENTEETVVDTFHVRTLEKHEFLLHLLLHSARYHVFEHGLRPLLDVHLWVKLHEERWDWERLAFQAIKRGCADWVYLALKLVTDAFQTPIPNRFFEIVPQPPQLARLQHLAYQQIWAERRVHYQTPAFLGSLLAQTGPIEAARVLLTRVRLNSKKLNTQTIPPLETLQRGGLILSLRRAVADARRVIPRYYRAYSNGKLSWSNLLRARRLAEGKAEILRTLVNRQPHRS